METKKILTRKRFSGPEKSEDFSRKTEIKEEKRKPILQSLVLATSLAVLSGCDFSYGYVRTDSYPSSRTYIHVPHPYYRDYPNPYYQPNYFFVPNRHPHNPYNQRWNHSHRSRRR